MSALTHQHAFCKLTTLQICALTYFFFEDVVDVRVTYILQMQLLVKYIGSMLFHWSTNVK